MDESGHDALPRPSKEISPASLRARKNVLANRKFWQIEKPEQKPSLDGFLYEVKTDAGGQEWFVPRENGYACQKEDEEHITAVALGVNRCFVGVISFESDEKMKTSVLHSNPFKNIPTEEEHAESPFAVFLSQLPESNTVRVLHLVYRPSIDMAVIQAAEQYVKEKFPEVEIKYTQTPFDEHFDFQMVNGEMTVWKAAKLEGTVVE